jgi:hypothetical protein
LYSPAVALGFVVIPKRSEGPASNAFAVALVHTTARCRGHIATLFTHLLIWPRVQKMTSFRKSRDTEGKFALTTPQNPLVNASPRELAAIAIKQLQEFSAAERKKQLAAAAAPSPKVNPPVLFADEPKPAASPAAQEVAAPDETSAVPPSPTSLSSTLSPNPVQKITKPAARKPAAPRPRASRRATKHNLNPKRSPRRRTVASFLPPLDPSSLEYHQRKCLICNHPQREEIEEDFINWCKPDEIVDVYELTGYRAVYRHAHATGLFTRRRMNLRFAAESLVEEVNCVDPCADAILRAIRMCTRLDDRGGWNEPPSRVIISSGGRVDPITLQPIHDQLPPLAVRALTRGQGPNQTPSGVEIVLDPSPSPETDAPSSDRHFGRLENEPK